MFELNFDMDKIRYKDLHNWLHAIFSAGFVIWFYFGYGIGIMEAWFLSWVIGFIWELGDGFKPWYTKFEYDFKQPQIVNWLKENLLYSNKFSLQDILVWNLGGGFLGTLFKQILT